MGGIVSDRAQTVTALAIALLCAAWLALRAARAWRRRPPGGKGGCSGCGHAAVLLAGLLCASGCSGGRSRVSPRGHEAPPERFVVTVRASRGPNLPATRPRDAGGPPGASRAAPETADRRVLHLEVDGRAVPIAPDRRRGIDGATATLRLAPGRHRFRAVWSVPRRGGRPAGAPGVRDAVEASRVVDTTRHGALAFDLWDYPAGRGCAGCIRAPFSLLARPAAEAAAFAQDRLGP